MQPLIGKWRDFQLVQGSLKRCVIYLEQWNGRIGVWLHLLNLMMESTSSFFFGFGVGEINFDVNGSVWEINSAHNHFLQIFYEFGMGALLSAIFFFYRLIKSLSLIENKYAKAFLLAVAAQLILNLFLDSTLQASQIG